MANLESKVQNPKLKVQNSVKFLLLLWAFLLLATAYSVVVPIGRGADEWAHYWYAEFIAEHGRLPLNAAEREAAGYKADWPPLYHLAAAAVTGWVETAGPPTFKYRADNVRRQLVPAQGPEAILHTEDERFPWQQEILVWHLGRFLSIVFSTGTLVVTYFVAREVFEGDRGAEVQRRGVGENNDLVRNSEDTMGNTFYGLRPVSPKTLALVAVAALAFIPRFLFTGMLFNYDSLTLLLASLFLWLVIRIAKGGYPRWGFWGLGALAGLALVTKYSTILLPLVIVLVAGSRVASSRVAGSRTERNNTLYALRSTVYMLRSPVFWRSLGQAALAYGAVIGWWFGYLIVNFNEIDTYGPVLGTLAPLLRGDASDRTAEGLFAWLSGGQAPTLDYIEKQSYTGWQLITQFLNTFWGNPVVRPYPLNWFVGTMTLVAFIAAIGLVLRWRRDLAARFWIGLLVFYCLLPVPLMLFRLFGARDALEAVQGRHILFLAGPAAAVLLVLGLLTVVAAGSAWAIRRKKQGQKVVRSQRADRTGTDSPRFPLPALRFTFYLLLGLLLAGALGQLVFMQHAYPPLLPVRTTGLSFPSVEPLPVEVTLPGGAEAIGYRLTTDSPQSLKVSLIWQGGEAYAPEDYQLELAMVDDEGEIYSGWRAYQTQARYPTRTWEPGDTIWDEGWLPLAGVPPGEYEIRWRLLGQFEEVLPWQTLTGYHLVQPGPASNTKPSMTLWRDGEPVAHPPLFKERETAQFTIHHSPFTIHNFRLLGPDNQSRSPVTTGPTWANFVIGPGWSPGDYFVAGQEDRGPFLQVADNGRNFTLPEIGQPAKANFEGRIKLLGYDLPSRRVQAGDGLPLTLYWQGLEWMGEEFVIFTRLLDNQGLVWGGYDRLARENYSTLLWAPGEIITDGFAVPVEPDAPDGIYMVSAGWYRQVNGQAQSLSIVDPDTGQATGLTAVMIGPVKVGGPPEGVTVTEVEPETRLGVALGDKIELLGFDLAAQASDAETLDLTLYWQALTLMEIDYTVFVHVRNAAGEQVLQKDSPPAGGAYPTSLWEPGEIIPDEIVVPLGNLPSGRYDLVAGLYDLSTGERLPVDGSLDGAILLQSIQVGE